MKHFRSTTTSVGLKLKRYVNFQICLFIFSKIKQSRFWLSAAKKSLRISHEREDNSNVNMPYLYFPTAITCQKGGGQCMTGSLQHIYSRKSCLSFTAQYLNVAGRPGDQCSLMHYTKMVTLKNFLVTCLSKFYCLWDGWADYWVCEYEFQAVETLFRNESNLQAQI